MTDDKTRAAIYTRVAVDPGGSVSEQQRQQAELEAYAKEHGLTVTAVYSDEGSASAYARTQRPAYREMLHQIDEGEIDVVLVWSIDRLTRSMAGFADLVDRTKRAGVKVVTVDGPAVDLSTDEGEGIARILGAWAEAESASRSERIKAGKRAAAERRRQQQDAAE